MIARVEAWGKNGTGGCCVGNAADVSTEDPLWGHPRPVLGATDPYLEPFCGHLSPKVDEIFQK